MESDLTRDGLLHPYCRRIELGYHRNAPEGERWRLLCYGKGTGEGKGGGKTRGQGKGKKESYSPPARIYAEKAFVLYPLVSSCRGATFYFDGTNGVQLTGRSRTGRFTPAAIYYAPVPETVSFSVSPEKCIPSPSRKRKFLAHMSISLCEEDLVTGALACHDEEKDGIVIPIQRPKNGAIAEQGCLSLNGVQNHSEITAVGQYESTDKGARLDRVIIGLPVRSGGANISFQLMYTQPYSGTTKCRIRKTRRTEIERGLDPRWECSPTDKANALPTARALVKGLKIVSPLPLCPVPAAAPLTEASQSKGSSSAVSPVSKE